MRALSQRPIKLETYRCVKKLFLFYTHTQSPGLGVAPLPPVMKGRNQEPLRRLALFELCGSFNGG